MPFGFPRKSGFPSLNMQDSLTITSGLPSLHMQDSLEKWIPTCILIRYRFTNESHFSTIATVGLPGFAQSLLTLMGSCRICYIFI